MCYQETGETSIHLLIGGCSVQRVVDVVGDVGRESPVVGRVLEEVGDGHGRVGEPVDEDGFQKTLGVVESPAAESNPGKESNFSFKPQNLFILIGWIRGQTNLLKIIQICFDI